MNKNRFKRKRQCFIVQLNRTIGEHKERRNRKVTPKLYLGADLDSLITTTIKIKVSGTLYL